MGIFVAIPYKFRPLQYVNESIGRYSKEFGAFLKKRMETSRVTCRALETFLSYKCTYF